MTNKTPSYYSAIGRKKESTAIVYLVPIYGPPTELFLEVNGQDIGQYFQQNYTLLRNLSLPLRKVGLEKYYKIFIKVKGGGFAGQAESIKLGISRVLCKLDPLKARPILKSLGFLKRDARVKERRKYGLKKARKASQYSKR
uniref:Ribosomal protein S9 n=1 Tax=Phaeophyceae sp. TaxID=2249243 RepID=A0A8E5BDF2_9PHAE|nr:ribosomal protein S9 [Phaeophyceae sp.]